MASENDRPDDELGDPERARADRRDRRRRTRMVVDNAGVKRLRQALARRAHKKDGGREPSP